MSKFDKSKQKKRKSQLMSSAEVLQSLLQDVHSNPLSTQFKRWKLWQNWSEVVGETIAKNSRPVKIERRNLVVWVCHPVQLQELIFVKKPLMEKINEYMGHRWITNIHFTLEDKHVPEVGEDEQLEKDLDKLSK